MQKGKKLQQICCCPYANDQCNPNCVIAKAHVFCMWSVARRTHGVAAWVEELSLVNACVCNLVRLAWIHIQSFIQIHGQTDIGSRGRTLCIHIYNIYTTMNKQYAHVFVCLVAKFGLSPLLDLWNWGTFSNLLSVPKSIFFGCSCDSRKR